VFLSVLFWSWLWGIAGAFVAVPLLLALRAVSQRSRRLRLVHIYLDADAVDVRGLGSPRSGPARVIGARDDAPVAGEAERRRPGR